MSTLVRTKVAAFTLRVVHSKPLDFTSRNGDFDIAHGVGSENIINTVGMKQMNNAPFSILITTGENSPQTCFGTLAQS